MVYIFGVNINESLLVKKALEGFYGIGPSVSRRIMARLYIHETAKVGSLGPRTVTDLTAELTGLKLENDLRREIQDNIKRLNEMKCYRGRRHAMGLPVRGQNTRSQIITARKLNRLERRG